MKVSDVSKAAPASAVGAVKKSARVESVNAAPAVDEVSFAGIPPEELTPRVREALTALVSEVQKLREELSTTRARIDELEHLADTDPLLGVSNRRAFVRDLNRAVAMAERYETPSALVFADLNDLKKINDTFGHGAGDAALAHVAAVLSANVRQTDAVGRLGGDEFGVILTQNDQPTAKLKAQSLAELVAATPIEWKDKRFTAHISCGVVEIRKGATIEEALQLADTAMYEVKKAR
ncbi:MAG: GGDEF domain-containing protein [Amphiplicatus sp.]